MKLILFINSRFGGALQVRKKLALDHFPSEKRLQASVYIVNNIFNSISSMFSSAVHIQVSSCFLIPHLHFFTFIHCRNGSPTSHLAYQKEVAPLSGSMFWVFSPSSLTLNRRSPIRSPPSSRVYITIRQRQCPM